MLPILEKWLSGNAVRMAAQLRKPTGWLSRIVSRKMNESNAPMYDSMLRSVDFKQARSALEIGFGNGNLFRKVMAASPGIQLSGIDYSPDMVRQARRNLRAAVKAGRLTLAAGSSDQLPYADSSFDIVYCVNVVYFWDQPAVHLAEIRRVLRPGGRFVAMLRSRSSMQHLPFVQQGFTMYEALDWEAILRGNQFAQVETHVLQEPPLTFAGQTLMPISLCIVGYRD